MNLSPDYPPTTLEDARAALDCISPDMPRDDWVNVCMAFKSEFPNDFDLFNDWSAAGETYKISDALATWNSVNQTGGLTIGTLFKYAIDGGYKSGKQPSQPDEADRLKRKREREQAAIMEEIQKQARNKEAAQTAQNIWDSASPPDRNHPYLVKKNINPIGIKQGADFKLLIPMHSQSGELVGLQEIRYDGEKKFIYGTAAKGAYMRISGSTSTYVVAEGYATACSILDATDHNVAVAFSCGNLKATAEAIRKNRPDDTIIIAGDAGEEEKATEAARAVNGRVAIASGEKGTDFNDIANTGEDIKALINGSVIPPIIEAECNTSKFAFEGIESIRRDIKPPSWLIRDYLEKDTHTLLFGESESCKSFLVMDMALHVATGMDWCGEPVAQGPVFYICGEGRGGINRRIVAWCIAHDKMGADIPFFKSVNPSRFYDKEAAEDVALAIQDMTKGHGKPALIVIDTLAKNLGADENSNQDIAQYVRHVDDNITRPFGCSVITVHHVGHGDKQRARGAYALKADFDADMLVERAKSDFSDQVIFTPGKMKDGPKGAPLAFNPRVVELGLVDEWDRPVNSIILSPAEMVPMEADKCMGKTQKQALDILEKMYEVAQENLQDRGDAPCGAYVETVKWRATLEAAKVDGKPLLGKYQRQRFAVVRNSLLESRAIIIEGPHVMLSFRA